MSKIDEIISFIGYCRIKGFDEDDLAIMNSDELCDLANDYGNWLIKTLYVLDAPSTNNTIQQIKEQQ